MAEERGHWELTAAGIAEAERILRELGGEAA
jgi:hypothetical protein